MVKKVLYNLYFDYNDDENKKNIYKGNITTKYTQ